MKNRVVSVLPTETTNMEEHFHHRPVRTWWHRSGLFCGITEYNNNNNVSKNKPNYSQLFWLLNYFHNVCHYSPTFVQFHIIIDNLTHYWEWLLICVLVQLKLDNGFVRRRVGLIFAPCYLFLSLVLKKDGTSSFSLLLLQQRFVRE